MNYNKQQLGLLGERIAARWMLRSGWKFVAHRFRDGHRDIDLIMRRGSEIAFVEVKARSATIFGSPVESVHVRKQRELTKAARAWIRTNRNSGHNYRFDVVGILVNGQNVRIRHIENAFYCPEIAKNG